MLGSLEDLWIQVLQSLRDRVQQPSFGTWFQPTRAVDLDGNTLVVQVPHKLAKEQLESNYLWLIRECLADIAGNALDVRFVVMDPAIRDKTLAATQETMSVGSVGSQAAVHKPAVVLNPKYTFDSFVVGNSNRFAHAAALAVAESPGNAYNPLFIYGGVGLGKTHLMQAIGHYILARNSSARVVYVSCEAFLNEMIAALSRKDMGVFKSKYRDVDALMIDDIQFIAGKDQTQEEFFHTFNSLYEAGRQIVITSDRPPKDIATLEDRLRSRFEWGLTADIQPPDLETRIAILKRKADDESLVVPNDVVVFIANQIQSNIRVLEGALIRVIAYSSLIDSEISIDIAKQVLKDIIPMDKPHQLSIEYVQQIVAEYFSIRIDDLKSKSRARSVAYPRQIAMYVCRELTESPLARIGEEFGGRDHTTVIHACEKIAKESRQDSALAKAIKEIMDRLRKHN
jgi:chromosomal replication initiator protein